MKAIITYIVIILFIPFAVSAAPHISGRPEPRLDSVGRTPRERVASRALALGLRAPAAYPATVELLFLRVDFPDEGLEETDLSVCYSTLPTPVNGDRDPNTTGRGIWTDPSYAHEGDPDYWLNQAVSRFPAYFQEASYNNLLVNITVSEAVYRLPKPMCYYRDESVTGIQRLIIDAVAAADGDIDFSRYVSPSGAVVVIHAGAGEETDVNGDTSRDIWSLYYSSSTGCIDTNTAQSGCQPLSPDGVSISEFLIMPQTDSQDADLEHGYDGIADPFGVYVHEFGHWLGLPDLYDTSWLFPTNGIGSWGLMGYGIYNGDPPGSMPSQPEAWSKAFLGWVTLNGANTAVAGEDAGPKTLSPIMNDPTQVLKVPASPLYPGQYLLLENRRKTGFDSALPGEGMLVWLINEDYIEANLDTNTVNVGARGVRLVEADGLYNLLDNSDNGSAGDPFPGATNNTRLTPLSSPSSAPFNGAGWVSIRDIESGDDVSFRLGYAPLPPENLSGYLQSQDVLLTWTANTESDLAYYKVYRDNEVLASVAEATYTDTGAGAGCTYKVTAVDSSGNESAYSQEVTVQPAAGGGGGGCFIATAAYGSYLHPHVQTLRDFRDRHLLTNELGRAFVRLYYRYSPPIAEYIRRHEGIRIAARFGLTPIVLLVRYPLFMLCAMLMSILVVWSRRTRGRGGIERNC